MPVIHSFMLQILLITGVNLNVSPGIIEYATTTMVGPMTEEECWKTAADINSHAPIKVNNQTAVCNPIIYPNRGQMGENQIGH